jgi:hypothetical protein
MFYKFVEKRYVPPLLEGRFRFGRLRYYQLRELATGDMWIGDRNEGVGLTKLNGTIYGSNPDHGPLFKRLEDARVLRAEGGDLSAFSFSDISIRNEVDCFVFCIAEGDLEQLSCFTAAPAQPRYAYDGCVLLSDPAEIARRMWHRGTVNGVPLQLQFSQIAFGQVRYDWVERDLADGPAASGDPFEKSSGYEAQREWRFVLYPRVTREQDFVTVDFPASPDLIAEESLNVTLATQEANADADDVVALTNEAIVEEIRSIWRKWGAESSWNDPRLQQFDVALRSTDRSIRNAAWDAKDVLSRQLRDEAVRQFNLNVRPRLLRLYFQFRCNQKDYTFEQIDLGIVRGSDPQSLKWKFEVPPFV